MNGGPPPGSGPAARKVAAGLFVAVAALGCGPPTRAVDPFVDAPSGIAFEHFNGMSGERYMVEAMGGGAALFDYDGDGDLDAYLVQGTMLGPGKALADATLPPREPLPLRDRLFRNDLAAGARGTRTPRFTDVTEASGIDARGYGTGVAVGDADGDGWPDLYVLNFGPNQLWHNDGDGTFTDVTAESGTGDPRWSAGATFFDYDLDGDLDLFVANYVEFPFDSFVPCTSANGFKDYCGPLTYRPAADTLYRNRGDGTFEDVSWSAGVVFGFGSALGVVADDLDGDGLPDLYVANDLMPNSLWINRGDGTFQNRAMAAGCALNADGRAEASMGVDAGDLDGDGDDDLFMTHLRGQSNTLYVNLGGGRFEDRTAALGLAEPSLPFTGFGLAIFDYDNDGLIDLFTANGEVKILEPLFRLGDPVALRQTNQLFRGRDDGRFQEVGEAAGAAFARAEVGRGVAAGDVDDDGDVDLLVLDNAGPARLLLNQVGQDRPWVGLRLRSRTGRGDVTGARVAVVRRGARTLWRRSHRDGSFASANDPRVVVGLGDGAEIERVEVTWPGGAREAWTGVEVGRYNTLVEGTGHPLPPAASAAASGAL